MKNLKVLIVDDDSLFRNILYVSSNNTPYVEKAVTCPDAITAFNLLSKEEYDVIILDHYMPIMTGLQAMEFLYNINNDIKIILFSGSDDESVFNTAIEYGAYAYFKKPTSGNADKNMEIITNRLNEYFDIISKTKQSTTPKKVEEKSNTVKQQVLDTTKLKQSELILIASSTGGPKAIDKILNKIPKDFVKPMLIVQHMPIGFTEFYANSLRNKHDLPIKEVVHDDVMENGNIYIAKGGYHVELDKNSKGEIIFKLNDDILVNGVRPAADVTFKSAANNLGGINTLSIVLTGIGKDGTSGVEALRQTTNNITITENEESCVVYGMSKSVEGENLSDHSMHIDEISELLGGIVK